MRPLLALCGLSLTSLACPAQADPDAIYRELELVTRMRVVCSNEHFGRIDDLILAVPEGRITAAVVTYAVEGGVRRVRVPFEDLTYNANANWLDLKECGDGGHAHEVFDGKKIRVQRKADGSCAGAVLASTLKQARVKLTDGVATVHGIEFDLSSGRAGFLDVAVGTARAGDRELHPAPWSVFGWQVADDKAKHKLAISMAHTKKFLAGTPNLIEIIIPDPLRRARVYKAFGVKPPN